MSSTAFTLFALTIGLAALVGILVLAVFRFRAAARGTDRPRERLSEEAFMATAIQEAMKGKVGAGPVVMAGGAPPGPAPGRLLDERELERAVSDRVAHLASGLAHELANSLTALHGYSRMIDMTSLSQTDRSSLEAVQEETSLMGDTLDAFRRIVRRPELTRDLFELRHLVEDAVAIVEVESQLPRGSIARVVPATAVIDGDRVLLEEALAHLVRNAVEACRETDTIRTITVSATLDPVRRASTITVSDRGPGVLHDDRPRLFEPFFSTKPKRAGFGLAFARHIVYAHEGLVSAQHPEEGGLEVSMTVPSAVSASKVSAGR